MTTRDSGERGAGIRVPLPPQVYLAGLPELTRKLQLADCSVTADLNTAGYGGTEPRRTHPTLGARGR